MNFYKHATTENMQLCRDWCTCPDKHMCTHIRPSAEASRSRTPKCQEGGVGSRRLGGAHYTPTRLAEPPTNDPPKPVLAHQCPLGLFVLRGLRREALDVSAASCLKAKVHYGYGYLS